MGTEQKAEDYSLTSFDFVIIEKDKLLDALVKNRDSHDEIYQAAVQGYWIKCKEVLEEKKEEFTKAIDGVTAQFDTQYKGLDTAIFSKDKPGVHDFQVGFKFNYYWPLAYPTNHLDDYNRVIEMLQFSVADKVRLTAQHFSAYVRNDWNWKGDFASSNLGYVKYVTGAIFAQTLAISGMAVASGGAAYNFARNNGQ